MSDQAIVNTREFGPILVLDGVSVSLTRDEDDGQLYAHISSDDVPATGMDDTGYPFLEVKLNDWTLYRLDRP